jgi:hypothetical protein
MDARAHVGRNMLLYRFVIFNLLALTWLAGIEVYTGGFLSGLFLNDISRITAGTAALFLITYCCSIKVMWQTNQEVSSWDRWAWRELTEVSGSYRLERVTYIENCAVWMAYLGLLGTVVGFAIAVSNVGDHDFASLEGVKAMGQTLFAGMSTAFNTTIVGGVLGLWTEMNYRMLKTQVALIASAEERLVQATLAD